MGFNKESKLIANYVNAFEKLTFKLLKKLSATTYVEVFGKHEITGEDYAWRDLYVTSTPINMMKKRDYIKDTLIAIDYKRESSWTEPVAIAFMSEVMDLYLGEEENKEIEGYAEFIEAKANEISKRYNVTKSRLKTQVALFINNLENGKDKFNIYSYFTPYEIIFWKYRDINKLQEDIENGKVRPSELNLLKELEIIE